MNNNLKPDSQLFRFMLRAQLVARKADRISAVNTKYSETGYAMLVVSVITILLFSMMGAFLTMTDINRAATNAYISGNNTFYAAESGLNARAQLIRSKVGSYAIPTGTSATNVGECFSAASTAAIQYSLSGGTTNDFGCKDYAFNYTIGSSADTVVGNGYGIVTTRIQQPDLYISTTYVKDNPSGLAVYPRQSIIPADDLFAGMNMLEYTHRVYAAARKQGGNATDRTVLQLDFNTRFVPLFQFAVFYDQDLEITPGPDMFINGRVHTNSNLFLTSNGKLCVAGSVSAQGNIFNRRKHQGTGGEQTSNGLVYLYPSSTNCNSGMTQVATKRLINNIGFNGSNYATSLNTNDLLQSNSGNNDSSNRPNMTARFGNNVLDRVKNIKVPKPDFLAKTDSLGALSNYYTKADLRIERKSNPAANAIPFSAASIAQGMGDGSTCSSFNVADDKVGKSTSLCTQFSAGQLHSLRQPVLVRTGQTTDDDRLCTTELTGVTADTSTAINALTAAQKNTLARALETAIVSQKGIVNYSDIKTTKLKDYFSGDIKTLFDNYLTSAGITTVTATALENSTLASIAAIAGDCFKAAPIQLYDNFYNNREGRTNAARAVLNAAGGNTSMLQLNIESLTIWNRDGLFVNLQVDGSGNPLLDGSSKYQVVTNGHNSGQGNSTAQLIFKQAAIPTAMVTCGTNDTLCKGSFRHLGLAGADNSEGGLVFHLTVDANNTPGTNTGYTAKQSPYGFAIVGGRQLPGALTIATDQAAYLQGDYNFNAGTGFTGAGPFFSSVSAGGSFGTTLDPSTNSAWTMAGLSNRAVNNGGYKLPASILADSLNLVSNTCLNNNGILNCGQKNNKPNAAATTINAAFLAGNDIMPPTGSNDYSGGWHNYPRLHENWNGSLNIRGSFISLGAPLQVSGTWQNTLYDPPTRNWDYDVDFNNVSNLPPLTPNIVYLRQQVFGRSYN